MLPLPCDPQAAGANIADRIRQHPPTSPTAPGARGTHRGGVSRAQFPHGLGVGIQHCSPASSDAMTLSYDGGNGLPLGSTVGSVTEAFTHSQFGELATQSASHGGNRLSLTTPGGTINATYDDQDRLLTYGDTVVARIFLLGNVGLRYLWAYQLQLWCDVLYHRTYEPSSRQRTPHDVGPRPGEGAAFARTRPIVLRHGFPLAGG